LLARLLPEACGFALADADSKTLGVAGEFPVVLAEAWIRDLRLASRSSSAGTVHSRSMDESRLVCLELRGANDALMGVLLAHIPEAATSRLWPDPAFVAANRLHSVLPLLKRDLASLSQIPAAVRVEPAAPPKPKLDSSDAVIDWLREALEQDRMQLYAQRIMPLQDFKKPSGYELLVRLREEDGHIVAPEEFLSAAYRYQLMPAVDRWVTEHAISMLQPLANLFRSSEISIAINMSGQSLGDRLFVQRLSERLSSAGIPPARITLEIAEQTALANVSQAVDMMGQLRQLGCGVALDDFGSGTSSLACLDEFPVTRIKLDGSLIRNILTNARSEEKARGLVQAAKSRSMDTVAVFVENEGIARKVRSLGIDYAQGYVFARPEPLEHVLSAMRKDASRRVNIADVDH
jgi:EAL domain-containing protein (putative c-di-GMP-specific phosphodiesterase class I)